MAYLIPPLVRTAPTVAPAVGGLYGAAGGNVVTLAAPARLVGGVQYIASNCGTHGLMPVDCPPLTPVDDTTATGPGLGTVFPGTIVYGADECDLLRTDAEAAARAVHLLTLNERQDVERHVAGLLESMAGEPRTVGAGAEIDRFAQAVAIAEAELGSLGIVGVVHAPAGAIVLAQRAGALRWQGGQALTPGGHHWAFGGGYEAMVNLVYVTGPVSVFRSEVSTTSGVSVRKNERLVVAQREVVAAWECLTVAINYGGTV